MTPGQKTQNKFEHYDVTEVGMKYNMIDINSDMGIIQLKKINKNWLIRKNFYNFYKKKLKNLPIKFQKINFKNIKHSYHLFYVVIDKLKTKRKRDELVMYLRKNKIGCGINYRSVTDMSVFRKKFGWNDKTCKNSKYVGDNTLSLPLYPSLKKKEAEYICEKIKKFFKV